MPLPGAAYQQPVQPQTQNPSMMAAIQQLNAQQTAPVAPVAPNPAPAGMPQEDFIPQAAATNPSFLDKIRAMPPNRLAAIISALGGLATAPQNDKQIKQSQYIQGIGNSLLGSMTASDAAQKMGGGTNLTPAGTKGPTSETYTKNADGTYQRIEKGDTMTIGGSLMSPPQ